MSTPLRERICDDLFVFTAQPKGGEGADVLNVRMVQVVEDAEGLSPFIQGLVWLALGEIGIA